MKQGRPMTTKNWFRLVVVIIALAGALTVMFQNSQSVRIRLFLVTIDAPLIVILGLTLGAGVLIGWLLPTLLRRRRH